MKKRRKITIFVAMLMSFSLCIANLAGLATVVSASDFEEDYEDPVGYPDPDAGQETYSEPAAEEPEEDSYEEQRRREEEAAAEAQRQAEAEAQRIADEQRQAEEQAEVERQSALEREAQKALEKQKLDEANAAAEAAKKAAEEEEAKAKAAAEAAKKAAEEEEEKKKQEDHSYGLKISSDGGSISHIVLTATVGDGDYLVFNVANIGNNDVDLIYGISSASSNVFALSLLSGSSDLKVGSTDSFQIAINPSASAGNYSARLYFKDSKDTGDEYTRYIDVSANITNVPHVSKVVVAPQSVKISKGSNYNFSAVVQGRDGDVSQDVTWTISGMRSVDTNINENGVLTVSKDENVSSFQVIATSMQDPSVSGSATVIVQNNSYNVNAYAFPAYGGIVTGGGAVQQGGSVIVSAIPNNNFYFDGWYMNNKRISTATNFPIDNIQSNIEIAAVFKQSYVTVTATPEHEYAGSVVGGGTIIYGGSTTLSAKANDGFVFTGWKEGDDIISKDASITINNITSDRKIIAKFAKTRYNITLSTYPYDGGYVLGSGTFNWGDKAKLKAEAAPGYVFQYWMVNNQVVCRTPECEVCDIDRDFAFTAVFMKQGVITHTMTAGVATTGGTISPSGVLTVGHGTSLTYTITPKTGFTILAVAVDGVQVGPVSTYTFTDITTNHAIAAAFIQTQTPAASKTETSKTTKKEQKPAEQTVEKKEETKDPETEQQSKVQKKYADPVVVSENAIVDMKNAATGTAGDEFVLQMDFTEVKMPTEEELKVAAEESSVPQTSNVLKRLGITTDEVQTYIQEGNSKQILESAFYEGYLDAHADNEFAPPVVTPNYSSVSREDLKQVPQDAFNPSLPNFTEVVESLFSPTEVAEMANDTSFKINVSLKDADSTISEKDKKVLNSAVGQKPLKYFDLTMVKMFNGQAANIKELTVPMRVIVRIPDKDYKDGVEYSVLRDHDGQLDVLPDLDNDPHTITFETDRFSAYAIAEKKATAKEIAINYAVGAIITFILAVICMVMLIVHHMRYKKLHALHQELTRKVHEHNQFHS